MSKDNPFPPIDYTDEHGNEYLVATPMRKAATDLYTACRAALNVIEQLLAGGGLLDGSDVVKITKAIAKAECRETEEAK